MFYYRSQDCYGGIGKDTRGAIREDETRQDWRASASGEADEETERGYSEEGSRSAVAVRGNNSIVCMYLVYE
jgi:hypothetical protein